MSICIVFVINLVIIIYRYPYQAYIQNAFYMNQAYKDTVLTNVAYFGDRGGFFQDCFKSLDQISKVPNVRSRWGLIQNSVWVDMTGPVYVPFFDAENFLLNNVNLDLELVRTDPEFLLYDEVAPNVKYRIEMRNPSLSIRRYKPSAPIVSSIARSLEKSKAKYSYRNVDMKAINFPKDLTRITIPNITTGQIPSRVIFAFVDSQGFRGNYKKNPFNFQNFEYLEFILYVNSERHPSIVVVNDFKANLYSRSYDLFCDQLGLHQGKTNGISYKDYGYGYGAVVFDLTSDHSASEDHFSLIQTGDIYAEINFKKALPSEITCIIYSEFEKLVEIDEFRNIKTDEQLF
jgi:hypothetical protein